MFNCTQDNCIIEEIVVKYAKENLILANIFMKSSFVTRFLTDEKETIIDYVAKSGGLLGLAMGFSVVSLAEILHCIISIISEYTKRVWKTKLICY